MGMNPALNPEGWGQMTSDHLRRSYTTVQSAGVVR
jgi:hypothetical protein